MRKTELENKIDQKKRRIYRQRKKMCGTVEKPRLCVYRSLRHIYAQLVDDTEGKTLAAVSTLTPELVEQLKGKKKVEKATFVGTLVANRAKELGIEQIVFDRHGYKYHGRIKALAEAARKAGLKF